MCNMPSKTYIATKIGIGNGKASPSSGRYALVALILCSLHRSSSGPVQLPFSWDQQALQAPSNSIILFKIRDILMYTINFIYPTRPLRSMLILLQKPLSIILDIWLLASLNHS